MTLCVVCVSDRSRVWLKSWHNEKRGWQSGRQNNHVIVAVKWKLSSFCGEEVLLVSQGASVP